MTDTDISSRHRKTFEQIRQFDAAGNQFWSARDLAPMLEYQYWRNFMRVVEKAKMAC